MYPAKLFLLNVMICLVTGLVGQDCLGFTAYTQEFIDEIIPGCKNVNGTIVIGRYDQPAQIVDLSPLKDVETISGSLVIINSKLENLDDLQNLKSVGSELFIDDNKYLKSAHLPHLNSIQLNLNISNNDSLKTISGDLQDFLYLNKIEIINNASLDSLSLLRNLRTSNICRIKDNPLLSNVNMLQSIQELTSLYLDNLPSLKSLLFPNISAVKILELVELPKVTEICTFNALNSIQDFRIESCDSISNFTCTSDWPLTLNNLSIVDNDNLQDLSGFEQLKVEHQLIIEGNPNLHHIQFDSIADLNTISIKNNLELKTVAGFDNLDSLGKLIRIEGSNELEEISNFNNLRIIGGDLSANPQGIILKNLPKLKNTNFFPELFSIRGDISIDSCGIDSLYGFEALKIFTNGVYVVTNNSKLRIVDFDDQIKYLNEGISITNNSLLEQIHFQNELRHTVFLNINRNPNLISVTGLQSINNFSLFLQDLPSLIDFNALNNTDSLRRFSIWNINLSTIDFLPNLEHCLSRIAITNNENLESLENFNSVNNWIIPPVGSGSFIIEGNENLIALNGFENFIGNDKTSLFVEDNALLTSMDGFHNVVDARNVFIRDNPNLTSLEALQLVDIDKELLVENNASLVDISALQSIDSIGTFCTVIDNASLSDCDVICSLDSNAYIGTDLIISNNADSCSSLDSILYFCQNPVSTTDQLALSSFKVFPNPVHSFLNIELGEKLNGTLQIYSSLGQLEHSALMTNDFITLNIDHLKPGIYILEIRSTDFQKGIAIKWVKI